MRSQEAEVHTYMHHQVADQSEGRVLLFAELILRPITSPQQGSKISSGPMRSHDTYIQAHTHMHMPIHTYSHDLVHTCVHT